MCLSNLQTKESTAEKIQWDTDLSLPSLDEKKENPGVAGAFSGIINGCLLVVGGTNFPNKMPWEGGMKQWSKTLYSFDLINKKWTIIEDFLPNALGYGISIQLDNGLLCIGGCDINSCYSDVFLISSEQKKWVIDTNWPILPVPLACGTGTISGNRVYLFGGQTSMNRQIASSYAFFLDLKDKKKGWQSLPSWPGEAKGYSVSTTLNGKIYLFSGRNYDDKELLNVHTDGFVFTPETETWSKLQGHFPVMAGSAFSDEKENIFFVGGVEKQFPTTPEHPGFCNKVRCYNTKSNNITLWSKSPYSIPVTTNLVKYGDTIYITSGEIRPGVRTPYILRGIIQ